MCHGGTVVFLILKSTIVQTFPSLTCNICLKEIMTQRPGGVGSATNTTTQLFVWFLCMWDLGWNCKWNFGKKCVTRLGGQDRCNIRREFKFHLVVGIHICFFFLVFVVFPILIFMCCSTQWKGGTVGDMLTKITS